MSKNALRYPSVDAMPESMQGPARRALERGKVSRAPVSREKRPRRDEEHNEQVVFFNRVRTLAINDPRYAAAARRTYSIPNGARVQKRTAGRLKAEGLKEGVSDTFTSYPSGNFHGLYIEMKSRTGSPSRQQSDWIQDSLALGYMAACCRGADEAMQVWRSYVEASFV